RTSAFISLGALPPLKGEGRVDEVDRGGVKSRHERLPPPARAHQLGCFRVELAEDRTRKHPSSARVALPRLAEEGGRLPPCFDTACGFAASPAQDEVSVWTASLRHFQAHFPVTLGVVGPVLAHLDEQEEVHGL